MTAAQPTLDDARGAGVWGDDARGGDAGDGDARGGDAGGGDARGGEGRFAGLLADLDAVLSVRVDELSDGEIRGELEVLERVTRRAETRTCRLASTLTRREARRATAADPEDPRAGERAARDTRRELSQRLNWPPGRAKRAVADGKWLGSVPRAGSAADRGELSARHARILADTLNPLAAGAARDRLEAELVEAARQQDAVRFARTCRRRLAEVDHDAAMRDQARRAARQRASLMHDDQGMTRLSGQWAGLDGEIVASAIHAFRRPDAPGEHRDAQRATGDAVVDALRAALDAGRAPSEHGVRPHVIVTVPVAAVGAGAGAATARWSGPMAYGEVRRALDDAGLSWVAVDDASGLPMVASPESRHVPVGLWRALQVRDAGCIAHGCDAPADWCDVMHLGDRYADGGRLSLDNAALGCRRHHRKLDLAGWTITWDHGRPILHHPQHLPERTDRTRDGPDP